MHILLPPSEGKAAPEAGPPLDLAALAAPNLEPLRRQVADSLARLCADPDEAAKVLKLGQRQRGDLAHNCRLFSGPTAAAAEVYTGVLFDALGLADFPPQARQRAARRLLIFSGLWGVLRPDDAIPAYRCPAGTVLPGLDGARSTGLGTFWGRRLADHMPALVGDEFILDLRSGPYQAMWRPHGRHVAVRVLHEKTVDGRAVRSVVSHFNKAVKGRLAADLLCDEGEPTSAAELVDALRDLKYRVEVDADRPRHLDVVVAQV